MYALPYRHANPSPGPHNDLIGIGAPDGNTGDPCHTTRHAGPHRAVRKVEVRAFGFAGLDLGSPSLVAACPSTLLVTFGLHPILPNEPSFRKHLWPWTCETLALLPPLRSVLRDLAPSDSLPATISLLRPRLTSRSGACAPSSFRTQGEISPGKNAVLPRTTAGST